MGNSPLRRLRIHGDNIIECDRALDLIALAYNAEIIRIESDIYLPIFLLQRENQQLFQVELFGGHDRWNINFNVELSKYGAPIREAADAYVTMVSSNGTTEHLLVAIEFCSALPAGNNAWQRSGRAITCAEVGVPYLYFAEIGGVELDGDRNVKASRFPNPIVPFSYLTASNSLEVICVPVYEAHSAITSALREKFKATFGKNVSAQLLKCIIENESTEETLLTLVRKGLDLVRQLSEDRQSIDSFRADEWNDFLRLPSGERKAEWIEKSETKQLWKKKASSKVNLTDSFRAFFGEMEKILFYSIGAKEIPICLLPQKSLKGFRDILRQTYGDDSIVSIADEIRDKNKAIIIVWITGFKPRGDDSRPDRGLVPLARMLFGNDIDILTIVSGPAIPQTWKVFKEEPTKLASTNGLWQAIMNLSNYVIADSVTSKYGALGVSLNRNLERKHMSVEFNAAKPTGTFSEHDVDTAIHTFFSRQLNANIFEAMCNPPGGDWSGISYWEFASQTEHRWTSLPRVSEENAKRPDHIIQFNVKNKNVFLVIESKTHAKDLEENIGVRLTEYVKVLFDIAPTAFKKINADWTPFTSKTSPLLNTIPISGGAFCYKGLEEMRLAMENGNLDFIFAFEFKNDGEPSIGHVLLSGKCQFLKDILLSISLQFKGRFEIRIH